MDFFSKCFRVQGVLPFSRLADSSDEGVHPQLQDLQNENLVLRGQLAASHAMLDRQHDEYSKLKGQLERLHELEMERRYLSPRMDTAADASHPRATPLLAMCTPARKTAVKLEFASPGQSIATRVRRCVLANMLDKGRHSALVIYTFDIWRMLMYVRMQHDLGREENMRQRLQHEHDLQECKQLALNFAQERAEKDCETRVAAALNVHWRISEERLVVTNPQDVASPGDRAGDEMTLSALLNAGEHAYDAAQKRVEELEVDCEQLTQEKLELERRLREALEHNDALSQLIDSSQQLYQEEVEEAEVEIENTPARLQRVFKELEHGCSEAVLSSPLRSTYSYAQLREAKSKGQSHGRAMDKENMARNFASGTVVATRGNGSPMVKGRVRPLALAPG